MEFQRYPSLLKYRKRYTDTFVGREVVLLEKIHGSNFSFYWERNASGEISLKTAKRTSFLEKDDKFFNYKVIVAKYKASIEELAYHLFQDNQPHTLVVLGEYFGGIYNNKVPEGSVPIQRGQYGNYCRHNDFAIFDIIVDNVPLSWDIVVSHCERFGLLNVPEIRRGIWEDISDFDVENFKSPIAIRFNGENDISSPIEGVIIRPLDINQIDARVKWKCDGMVETPTKMGGPLPEKEDPYAKYWAMLNENRVATFYSKVGDGVWEDKNMGRLIGGLVNDTIDDIMEENAELDKKLSPKDIKHIRKKLSGKAAKLIRDHMKNT